MYKLLCTVSSNSYRICEPKTKWLVQKEYSEVDSNLDKLGFGNTQKKIELLI